MDEDDLKWKMSINIKILSIINKLFDKTWDRDLSKLIRQDNVILLEKWKIHIKILVGFN